MLGRPRAVEGGVRSFLLGILLHFVVCDMHSHSLLPGISGAAYLNSSSDYQRIELRSDRLFWNEVYRPATLSYWAKRDAATSTDLFDRSYWKRFLVGLPLALLARRFAREN